MKCTSHINWWSWRKCVYRQFLILPPTAWWWFESQTVASRRLPHTNIWIVIKSLVCLVGLQRNKLTAVWTMSRRHSMRSIDLGVGAPVASITTLKPKVIHTNWYEKTDTRNTWKASFSKFKYTTVPITSDIQWSDYRSGSALYGRFYLQAEVVRWRWKGLR